MSDHGNSQFDSLPIPLMLEVNRLCREFEAAQRAGKSPLIEEFIGHIAEEGRPAALKELMALHDELLTTATEALDSEKVTSSLTGGVDTPKVIDRYRVVRILGKGAFGLVYLAHDDQMQRLVAIKVPHRRRVSQSKDVELYLTEARVLASLDHPGIVPAYDVGSCDDGLPFVVSKFVEGQDLAQLVKENPLSFTAAADVVANVAEALHYAHCKGLVHRDIKPANILLSRNGKAFVTDFGLAIKEGDFGTGSENAGTPAYMSPEQARGAGHRVDGRSDVFSLGAVYYELLTGRRPFGGKTVAEILEQVLHRDVRPPRQINDTIPKESERICLKALAKRTSERYTTAKDLADDLRQHSYPQVGGESASIERPDSLELTDGRHDSKQAKLVSGFHLGRHGCSFQVVVTLVAFVAVLVPVSSLLFYQAQNLSYKPQNPVVRSGEEKAAYEKIISTSYSPWNGEYLQALTKYAKAYPDRPRSAIFTKLLMDESPIWIGVEKWNKLLAEWSKTDFQRVSPAEAKVLLAESDALLQSHGDFPDAPAIKELQLYLKAVKRRVDDAGERAHKALYARLDDPRISAVDMVITTDKKRYYFEKQPLERTTKEGERELVFLAFTDGTLTTVNGISLPIAKIANSRTPTGNFIWTSPQCRVREKAILLLDKVTDDNWETTFQQLLAILGTEPQMDPLLTLYFTQIFLKAGAEGSYCLQLGFKPDLDQMAEVSIELNWIDPSDAEGSRERKSTEELLKQMLRERKSRLDNTARLYAKLGKASRGTRYSAIGCLLRDDLNGTWVASTLPKNAESERTPYPELFVIIRGKGLSGVEAKKIASYPDLRVEGRRLYVVDTN